MLEELLQELLDRVDVQIQATFVSREQEYGRGSGEGCGSSRKSTAPSLSTVSIGLNLTKLRRCGSPVLNEGEDRFVERNYRMLSYDAVGARQVASLANWVDGIACLTRNKTAYLNRSEDLFSLTSSAEDQAMKAPRALGGDLLIRICRRFKLVRLSLLLTTTCQSSSLVMDR